MSLPLQNVLRSIDRHAPHGWRRMRVPNPGFLFLPELGMFVIASTALPTRALLDTINADPATGFPIARDPDGLRRFLKRNPSARHGRLHFNGYFLDEVVSLVSSMHQVPGHLSQVVQATQHDDDHLVPAELFDTGSSMRLRLMAA